MDIAQKEHCRHNQHDDDDNGIKIKFPFLVLIVQQSLQRVISFFNYGR